MKRFSEQLKKKSENIRMTARERSDLRDRLTTYMEYHPLPAELKTQKTVLSQSSVGSIISEPFRTIAVNMSYVRGLAGVFAVFLVVGVPVVAEWSVPGDVLYPVKTQITEELRSSLTLSPYAKVEWETQRLGRRVAEARLLASEGKLTAEAEATVALAVKKHTNAANEGIATIRKTDEDEAAMAEITFASAMEVQSEVLEGHIARDPDTADSVSEGHSVVALAGVLNGVRNDASVAQADSKPSYERLLGRVEIETTRAYELFDSVKKQASATEIQDIERRLADIERKVAQAIEIHSAETVQVENQIPDDEEVVIDTPNEEIEEILATTTQASSSRVVEVIPGEITDVPVAYKAEVLDSTMLLRAALTSAQKLTSFMTDIDVREIVSIEELVPVTLTPAERIVTIEDTLSQIARIQSEMESVDVSIELNEKVISAKVLLEEKLRISDEMLAQKNIDGAEKTVREAFIIVQDIQRLITQSLESTIPAPTLPALEDEQEDAEDAPATE